MARAKITLVNGTVQLRASCPISYLPIARDFVRYGSSVRDSGTGSQVCEALSSGGATLCASDDVALLATIRKHWQLWRNRQVRAASKL